MQTELVLDLDGVLVDFVGGALAFHGRADFPHEDVRWGIEACIGMDYNAFWDPLGYDFWADLGWTPEGPELLDRLERLFGDRIVLLSSPCGTRGCADGKIEWVRRHLPRYSDRLFIGVDKARWGGPCRLLVDDRQETADQWRLRGGMAVVPPRPWNGRRAECLPGGLFDPQRVAAEVAEVAWRTC